MLLIIFTTGNY